MVEVLEGVTFLSLRMIFKITPWAAETAYDILQTTKKEIRVKCYTCKDVQLQNVLDKEKNTELLSLLTLSLMT